MLHVHTYHPCLRLQPYVKQYTCIQAGDATTNCILPDTSVVMVFRCHGTVSDDATIFPPFAISGLRSTARHIHYHAGADNILVLLQPGAAMALLGIDMQAIYNQSTALDNFIPAATLRTLADKLQHSTTTAQCIAHIEQLLLSLLNGRQADALVTTAIQHIYKAGGNGSISAMVDKLYISHDAFEKRFRKAVGATPKQLASVVRMRHIVQGGTQGDSFTSLAHSAGYYDQAHFNKAFKQFTGQTPGDFFRAPRFW